MPSLQDPRKPDQVPAEYQALWAAVDPAEDDEQTPNRTAKPVQKGQMRRVAESLRQRYPQDPELEWALDQLANTRKAFFTVRNTMRAYENEHRRYHGLMRHWLGHLNAYREKDGLRRISLKDAYSMLTPPQDLAGLRDAPAKIRPDQAAVVSFGQKRDSDPAAG